MSDLNFNYFALKNANSSQRTDFTLSNIKPSQDDDLNLNQSIFKAYLETLKEKSDGAVRKTLQELQNTPISAVGRLFGNLQVNSVEQVDKMFDDLRIKPTDEIDDILSSMKSRVDEQIRKNSVNKTDKKDKADEADKNDKADKAEKASEDKKTDADIRAEKSEGKERFLDKYLKHTSEKMSKANNELNERSESISDSIERIREAIKRDDATGDRNDDELKGAAEEFVSRYNTFADTVNASKNSTVSSKARFINEMLDSYGSRLRKVGITKDDDGKLSLNKQQLEAANDKDIERALGKDDSFADFIDSQAKQLASYAQTDLYQNASAYTDGGNITQVSNISGSYFNMLS